MCPHLFTDSTRIRSTGILMTIIRSLNIAVDGGIHAIDRRVGSVLLFNMGMFMYFDMQIG
jgi:hypothetical protein